MLIDEIHTPDSSRFFYADGYTERQAAGLPQKQLSKEFVREWLMSQDFMGLDGQTLPTLTEDFIKLVSTRYIELFKKVTGTEFISNSSDSPLDRIEKNVEEWLAKRA
jgi:phosphoribosylaminoimidazole-succinocarboxamide synthase